MNRRPPRSTRTDTSFPTRLSSDLLMIPEIAPGRHGHLAAGVAHHDHRFDRGAAFDSDIDIGLERNLAAAPQALIGGDDDVGIEVLHARSEEHTSELPSLMRISYAVL